MSRAWKFSLAFALLVALCASALIWFVNTEVKKEFDQAVADTKGLSLTYTDLTVDILDQCVILENVDTTLPGGQHFTADKVRITAFDPSHPVPHFAAATAHGLALPVTKENFGDSTSVMQRLGIKSISGDVRLDYAYTPETGTLTLKTFALDDPNLGHASLWGTLSKVNLDDGRTEQLLGIHLNEATLRFADGTLMDILIAGCAKMMGLSEQQTVQSITTELEWLAGHAERQGNLPAQNVLLGLKRFLTDPGSITVTARPAKPVPVLYFFMGRDILENMRLLNMSTTANTHEDI